jgi:hypothetical protein
MHYVFAIFFYITHADAFLHPASVTGRASAAASSVAHSFVAASQHVPRQLNLSGNPCVPNDITRDYAQVVAAGKARATTVRSRVVIRR